MANPKDILVVTTSLVDGLFIKKYLKPVSAHIVAGTNLFSDFFASFKDVFGGRSETYQKQLTSLYNEAIEQIKLAAYEIGANCVVGLRIDMDEISGNGKSMFMLTAVGTAVVFEKELTDTAILPESTEKLKNVSIDRINILREKRIIIEKANTGSLPLNDDVWNFITTNQVDEIFPFLLKKFSEAIANERVSLSYPKNYYNSIVNYIVALPEQKKLDLLYNGIKDENNERVALELIEIVKELQLFDFERCMKLLKNSNFQIQKRGVHAATYDKPFYNSQDVLDLQEIRKILQQSFPERGKRTMKKQLLSSKEKEMWICECGKHNDMDTYCNGCSQDLFGFKQNELKPTVADDCISQKIELIQAYIKE